MTRYTVTLHRKAHRDIRCVPNHVVRRLDLLIEDLKVDPIPWRNWDVKALVNLDDTFRVRIGGYRVIYWVNSDQSNIEIMRVSKRASVYDPSSG